MWIVDTLLILVGYAGTVAGFRIVGGKSGRVAWAGIFTLFTGFALMFTGVLLAFAPRFFES